jgi:glutaredoxin
MDQQADPIVMYARERYCPDVERARRRLAQLGLDWEEHDVEADDEARAKMVAITGRPNVPTLVIGERVLIEPSVAAIDDALSHAGYDLAALLAPTR